MIRRPPPSSSDVSLASEPVAPAAATPERALRLTDLGAIGLNATVGSGIFLLPDDLFRAMGVWSPLAFVLCVFGLLPIAWCFADAARRTRLSGGPYEYARRELGPTLGFSVGWMCFANAVFSYAAVAAAAAAYAARLLPALAHTAAQQLFAVGAVAAFGVLNYIGARPGAWAIRIFTAGKFAVLLLLVLVLLPELSVARLHGAESATFSFAGLGSAVFMALFALQGFEVVGVPAGEARDPEKGVPRAVLGTLGVAGLLYVVVQSVLVLGSDRLSAVSDAPLADAALALSPSLGIFVAIGALVSTLGFVSGSALGTPRYLFAMAQQRQLPELLARLHPTTSSPYLAILVTSAIAGALVLPLDYRTLVGMSNVAVAVQYAATCFSVLRHGWRERGAGTESTRRMIWAAVGALSSAAIWLAATSAELIFALVALAFGLLLRGGLHLRSRSR